MYCAKITFSVEQGQLNLGETIIFNQRDGIARLCLNNPEKHNALGLAELDLIETALNNISNETRVLIIKSFDDRTFCSGANLSQILEGSLNGERFQSVTNRIANLRIPTVAALSGNIFGGGMELALSCDFRIGRTGIIMRIPAAALGLCYPIDGIKRLTERFGVSLAKRVLVGAEPFNADQMLSLRLIDSLHPKEMLDHAVEDYAETLLALAPMAVRAMLAIIHQLEMGALEQDQAKMLAEACAGSEDLKEGIIALKEKRSPVFKDR
jgi:enoyl-CoA hydratase